MFILKAIKTNIVNVTMSMLYDICAKKGGKLHYILILLLHLRPYQTTVYRYKRYIASFI